MFRKRRRNDNLIDSAELNSKKKKTTQHSDRRLQVWPGQAIYDIVGKASRRRKRRRQEKTRDFAKRGKKSIRFKNANG